MNRIPVVLFADRARAEAVRQRLASAGFDATLNENPKLAKLWFVSTDTGVRVMVQPEQFEKAEQFLLESDKTESTLRNAIRCPECGSLRVDYPQYARHSLLTNLAMGLSAQLRIIEKDFYCEDCHFAWPKEGSRTRRDRPHLAPYYFIEGVVQSEFEAAKNPSTPSEEHRKAA